MIDAIERTPGLEASPERVWRALTDPAELSAWFPDEARDLAVRPGGDGFQTPEAREHDVEGWRHELEELRAHLTAPG